ncbi:hypothetical protein BGZ50_008613 [Haplosporangium sp. Z 11]|nr:hypothetical protein BGZ50_008613 [Haplosporangium sp. Z 11]
MVTPPIALHIYTDFDSTVVLEDSGNNLLAHEMGIEELQRIDRLPKVDPGNVSLRRAEDMKWGRINITVKEAVDILTGTSDRVSFDKSNGNEAADRSYRVPIDPAFKQFHRYCKDHQIPITIVSIGLKPLIAGILEHHLGADHGIEIRANSLTTREDGSWRVLWRDSSPYGVEKGRALREARANDLQNPSSDHILWCGDGSSDFPAALVANNVMARKNTNLEKLCRANQIPHHSFTTFERVQEVVEEWMREHPRQPLEP